MGDRRSPLPAGAQSPISSVDANARPDPPGGRWRRFWRASRRHQPDVRMPNARCPASPSGSAVTMNTSSVTTNRSTTFGATLSKIRCDGHLIARILPGAFAATGGRGGRPPMGRPQVAPTRRAGPAIRGRPQVAPRKAGPAIRGRPQVAHTRKAGRAIRRGDLRSPRTPVVWKGSATPRLRGLPLIA